MSGMLGMPVGGTRKSLERAPFHYALIRDEKATGASAGDIGVANTWVDRTLNRVVTDRGGIVSRLSGTGTVELEAGVYLVKARTFWMNSGRSTIRLRDNTLGQTIVYGGSGHSAVGGNGSYCMGTLILRGQFELRRPTKITVQQECSDGYASGWTLGIACGMAPKEVFTHLELWKIRA